MDSNVPDVFTLSDDMTDVIHTLLLSLFFLALFATAEILYHYFSVKAEYTRKLVHVGTGLLTFLFPQFLSSHWWVLLLCASFALILIGSLKFNFLPSINAVERKTWGSLCYPLAVYTCFVVSVWHNNNAFFYLPILILAVSDPLAALVGKRLNWFPYRVFSQSKSVGGSFAFFTSAILLCSLPISILGLEGLSIGASLLLAFIGTCSEALSTKGYDNLVMPWVVVVVLLML
jgi:dolichol kinase